MNARKLGYFASTSGPRAPPLFPLPPVVQRRVGNRKHRVARVAKSRRRGAPRTKPNAKSKLRARCGRHRLGRVILPEREARPMRFLSRVLGVILITVSGVSAQKPIDPTVPLISPREPSIACNMTMSTARRHRTRSNKQPPILFFTPLPRRTVCRDMSSLPPLRDSRDLPGRLPTFSGPRR
jgi:hypothetical protein